MVKVKILEEGFHYLIWINRSKEERLSKIMGLELVWVEDQGSNQKWRSLLPRQKDNNPALGAASNKNFLIKLKKTQPKLMLQLKD
jgi:hypothetical protein